MEVKKNCIKLVINSNGQWKKRKEKGQRFLIKYRNSGSEKSGLRTPYRTNYPNLHNCENEARLLYGQNDNTKRLYISLKTIPLDF